MGLIKAIIVLLISIVVTELISNYFTTNKKKPYIKLIAPYLSNRCNLMLITIVILLTVM